MSKSNLRIVCAALASFAAGLVFTKTLTAIVPVSTNIRPQVIDLKVQREEKLFSISRNLSELVVAAESLHLNEEEALDFIMYPSSYHNVNSPDANLERTVQFFLDPDYTMQAKIARNDTVILWYIAQPGDFEKKNLVGLLWKDGYCKAVYAYFTPR
jgi:hypothetical protein